MGGDSPFQFTVVARDVNGLVITTDQTVVWQIVGDSSAGQIDTTGKFTALKAGAVRLKASIGDIIGQSARIVMIEKIPGDSTGPTPTVAYPDGQPDGKVDIFDLVNMARHGHQTGDNTTASIAEFKEMDISDQPNSDGKIDVFDLVILASNYGKGMTPTLAAPSILATLPIYEDAVSDLRVVTSSVTDQSADQIRSLLANQIEKQKNKYSEKRKKGGDGIRKIRKRTKGKKREPKKTKKHKTKDKKQEKIKKGGPQKKKKKKKKS